MSDNQKIAIVTGGARGIGFGIARALAAEGYSLAICGRSSADRVEGPMEDLQAFGQSVKYFRADIGSDTDRRSLVDSIYDEFGQVHVLVNNAGVAPNERTDILDATEESFDRVIGINLKGPYFLTQAVARRMINDLATSVSRAIVNITSISATVASTSRGEYCVSKAGLAMMSNLFAVRLAQHGISVFEVRPGLIRTDMTSGVVEKYDKLIEGGLTLQKRWGYPEDVGKVTAALARGDLPYSTGQVVMVDGGMLVDHL